MIAATREKPAGRTPSGDSAASENPEMLRALHAYRTEREAGRKPNRDEFLTHYPTIRTELAACLDALDFVYDAAPQVQRSVADSAAAAALEPLPAPHTLGDFQLLREVGRGGMGVVYEAEQLSLSRRVALKVLPFAATMDPRQLQRFQNEARAAAQLHHTNIVPVHYVGCERGVHFYAMQYIEGQSLADVILALRASGGRQRPAEHHADATTVYQGTDALRAPAAETCPVAALSSVRSANNVAYFRTIAELGIQAAEALDYAHQQGIVHRDVKPANLLVDVAGRLWVTDFGLAQIQSNARLTMTGDLVGTLRYMSPEQALAKRAVVDHRTDVYSLGATLYELLTLEPVFAGTDRQELLRQIASEEPAAPRRRNKAIAAELETIVLKALEKNPADRYTTAQELGEDLRRFLTNEPIRARQPTYRQRLFKWSRRHQTLVRMGTLGLMLAVVGLTIATILIGKAKQEAELQRDAAETQRNEADSQRRQSDANLGLAFQTLDQMYLKIAEEHLPRDARPGEVERKFLGSALQFYEEIARGNASNPGVRAVLGRAHRRAGDIYSKLGYRAKAVAAYIRTIALLEDLLADSPADEYARHELAAAYNNLGLAHRDADESLEGERSFHKALEVYQSLVLDYPNDRAYRDGVARAHINFGALLEQAQRSMEAEAEYRAALPVYQQLMEGFPSSADYARDLAGCHINLSKLLMDTNRPKEAEDSCRRAETGLEQVAADRRGEARYRERQAALFMNLGTVFARTGRVPAALEPFQRAAVIWKGLVTEFPNVPSYRTTLLMACLNVGQARQGGGDSPDALAAYQEGLEAARRLGKEFPDRSVTASGWAAGYLDRLGFLYGHMGKVAEAVASYRQLLELQPKNARACSYLAYILTSVPDPKVYDPAEAIRLAKIATEVAPKEPTGWTALGIACYRTQQWAEARDALKTVVKLGDANQDELFYLAMAHWQLGDKEDARRRYQEGVTWMRQHGQKEHPRRVEAAKLLDIKDPLKTKLPTNPEREVVPPPRQVPAQ